MKTNPRLGKLRKLDKGLKYHIMKFTSIGLGALIIPLSTYVGYLLGVANYPLALTLLFLEVILTFVDTLMWAWCLETMTKWR